MLAQTFVLAALMSSASAIYSASDCLNCFKSTEFATPYYCNSGEGSCRDITDTRCDFNDMVTTFPKCVNGFDSCNNRTFTVDDFSAVYAYQHTLDAGFGCYLHIDRTRNGTFGKLVIELDGNTSPD